MCIYILSHLFLMSISELFSGGPILYFPPTATAEPGEVLTVNTENRLVWSAVTPQGSVNGTPNEISVTSSGGSVSVALNPTIVAVPGALSYNAANNNSLEFPSNRGNSGQVLSSNGDGQIEWVDQSGGGSVTISGTPNEIIATTVGDSTTLAFDVATVIPGNLTINSTTSPITFPRSDGGAGQILATNGSGQIEWTNQSGGGSVTISGTPNEIVATTVGNVTTLAFDSVTVIPGNLMINSTTSPMAFPTSNGSAGQVLSTNGSGQLSWVNETSSGTIQGTTNEIIASTTGNVTTLAFDTHTHIPGQLTINSFSAPMAFPISNGSAGQVLSTNGSGQLSWVNETSSGTIQGTTNEIVATSVGNVTTLAFDAQTHIPGQLTLNTGLNAYSLPTTAGSSGQVLTWPASGSNVTWETADSDVNISGSSNQIAVTETTPNNYVISLTPTVDTTRLVTGSLNVNSAYEMPTTIGLENQVLSVGSGNNLVWASGSGSSGVNSITSTDPNVIIAGTASNPTIELTNQITLPAPAATNSFLIAPSTGSSYAKIGTDALSEEGQSAQLLVSNEDRDCYGSLALNYNASPELQNATLTLKNMNTVAGVSNSTTVISANGGINLAYSASTTTTNITANQLDMIDSANVNTTSIVAGTIWLAAGNDQTAISGTGVVFHALTPNEYSMPPNKGTENQVIQMDNAFAGTTKWATISGGGNVTITGTANQIAVAEPTNNDFVLSLPPSVDIGQLSINSAYNLPTSIGAAGDILTVPTSGTNLQWLPNVNVQGTTNEISVVERTTNNFAVGLPTTVDINTLNVGSVNVNSAYNLPTSIGTSGEVLSVGSGTNLVWAPPSTSYTNTDGNLVINNTTHTIDTASTIALKVGQGQNTNTLSPTQILLNSTISSYSTNIGQSTITLSHGALAPSIIMTPTTFTMSTVPCPVTIDYSLTSLQFGFGDPGVFQFQQIALYGNIYSKFMVFTFQNTSPILCQGSSGIFSSASFTMPQNFGSLLSSGSGVNQVIGRMPIQLYSSGGSFSYTAPGYIKLYNNDGTNYQLVFAFDTGTYTNQDLYNFQNGSYYVFWDKHQFPNDVPIIVCPYI